MGVSNVSKFAFECDFELDARMPALIVCDGYAYNESDTLPDGWAWVSITAQDDMLACPGCLAILRAACERMSVYAPLQPNGTVSIYLDFEGG